MAIPAVIFHAASPLPHFWGIAMPTDLPFALALIAIFGRHTSSEFRAFVLSLAIVDDALSVIAISAQSGNFAIHATLLAVIVGLLLPARVGEQFRHLLHPVSAGIVLPLFAITALSMPLNFSDFFSGESFWLGIARVAGKPIGVLLGAAIAIYIFRGLTKLSWNEIAVVGFVCSIGFSVSLLFASTATVSMSERAVVNAAIVLAIPVSAIAGGFALKSFGRNK
jgi:NhaA family Na+:H+ antiporter